ncbi:MAG: hypothetical protein HY015_05220 [Bacteroidetes bacterium]|nr:hypothetical protein [Bacteroidota bacterium]MBI3482361.1 hypothetical protein [Bacteroidota bacterium]
MNYKLSFQELAEIQKQILLKQQPTTLDKARKQVETLKLTSSQKIKMSRKEYVEQIDEAISHVNEGKYLSADDLERESENW